MPCITLDHTRLLALCFGDLSSSFSKMNALAYLPARWPHCLFVISDLDLDWDCDWVRGCYFRWPHTHTQFGFTLEFAKLTPQPNTLPYSFSPVFDIFQLDSILTNIMPNFLWFMAYNCQCLVRTIHLSDCVWGSSCWSLTVQTSSPPRTQGALELFKHLIKALFVLCLTLSKRKNIERSLFKLI